MLHPARIPGSVFCSAPLTVLFPLPVGELLAQRDFLEFADGGRPTLRSASFELGGMPNRANDDALGANAVENGIGSAANNEFTNTWLCSGTAQVRMIPQSFDHSHDACGKTFRCIGLVQGDVGANLREACSRRR